MSAPTLRKSPLWVIVALFFVIGGGLVLWLGFQPQATIQSWGNHLAPDGSLEMLTRIPLSTLQSGLILTGAVLLGLALLLLIWPGLILRFFGWLGSFFRLLPTDFMATFRALHGWPHFRLDGWLLAGMVLIAVLLRLPLLDRPMIHDEAYTVLTWAKGPLRYLLEDYHLPNNHIFHTLLVSFAYHVFGSQPWSVRLPAFIAGLLLIPAGYGLARGWYGRVAGLVAAGVIVLAPVLADYATFARGYPLFMLFSVLIFWLAARLMRRNNRFEWLLLCLFAALGFWTVPMMLYPFGAVCVWILLEGLLDPQAKAAYGSSGNAIGYLVGAGVLTILLTGLMYSPVLLNSGTEQLFNNPFIAPLSFSEFWPTLFESRLPETFAELTRSLGVPGQVLIISGVLLSLVFQRRAGRYPPHALWANVLWLIPVLLYRRQNAWARTWSFIYPLIFIWTAAGWVALAGWVRDKAVGTRKWVNRATPVAVAILFAAGLTVSLNHTLRICPGMVCPPGEEEREVMLLKPRLEDTDLVLVGTPSDVVFWYTFEQYGLSRDHFRKDLPFYRAYILVQTDEPQTVESLMADFGFSSDWFEMSSLTLLESTGRIQVYQLEANIERVQTEYGIK